MPNLHIVLNVDDMSGCVHPCKFMVHDLGCVSAIVPVPKQKPGPEDDLKTFDDLDFAGEDLKATNVTTVSSTVLLPLWIHSTIVVQLDVEATSAE